MSLRNSEVSYGAAAKVLHWASVALIAGGWTLGSFGDDLPRDVRPLFLFLHISAGLLLLAALALRLAWRAVDAPPAPDPVPLGAWAERLAKATHYLLYVLMLLAPLAGIATQFLRGDALPVLGLAEIASPWAANRGSARSAKEVHEFLANALVAIAVLHAAAALFHHWVLRDRTLLRMLPGRG